MFPVPTVEPPGHYLQVLNLVSPQLSTISLLSALQGAVWLLLDHALDPSASLSVSG